MTHASTATTPRPTTARGRPISVLVVDGNARTASVLVKLLGVDGFQVEVVADTAAVLLRLEQGRVPDVVVMDVSPGRSDQAALRRIHGYYPALPIIFVTSHPHQAEALARGVAAPCRILTKPIDYSELVNNLAYPIGWGDGIGRPVARRAPH